MKKTTLFISLLAIATACTTNLSDTNKPIDFEGNWISKDYIEAINLNHSPNETAKNLRFYATELVINKKNGDSIVVYNGQMERASLPFKRLGDTLRLKMRTGAFADILYSSEDKTIFFIDKDLNRTFRFTKADSSLLDKTYEMPIAFPTAVNKATFEGFWDLVEHNSTQKVVQFDKFGSLKGWDKFDSYTVCVNGDCAANEDGDLVFLNNKAQSDAYGFYSKGDTVTIYNLQNINDPDGKPILRNGQPMGLLIRKK